MVATTEAPWQIKAWGRAYVIGRGGSQIGKRRRLSAHYHIYFEICQESLMSHFKEQSMTSAATVPGQKVMSEIDHLPDVC